MGCVVRKDIPFQHHHLLEVIGERTHSRQPGHSSSDYDHLFTYGGGRRCHLSTLLRSPPERDVLACREDTATRDVAKDVRLDPGWNYVPRSISIGTESPTPLRRMLRPRFAPWVQANLG